MAQSWSWDSQIAVKKKQQKKQAIYLSYQEKRRKSLILNVKHFNIKYFK